MVKLALKTVNREGHPPILPLPSLSLWPVFMGLSLVLGGWEAFTRPHIRAKNRHYRGEV